MIFNHAVLPFTLKPNPESFQDLGWGSRETLRCNARSCERTLWPAPKRPLEARWLWMHRRTDDLPLRHLPLRHCEATVAAICVRVTVFSDMPPDILITGDAAERRIRRVLTLLGTVLWGVGVDGLRSESPDEQTRRQKNDTCYNQVYPHEALRSANN